jgi:plastocyanin
MQERRITDERSDAFPPVPDDSRMFRPALVALSQPFTNFFDCGMRIVSVVNIRNGMLRAVLTLAAGICCAFIPPAVANGQTRQETGIVRGVVRVPVTDDFTAEMVRGRENLHYHSHMDHSSDTVLPYRLGEKAVVYIESTGGGTFDPPAIHPTLDQRQMMFRPLVLPVCAGTTVDFPNSDNLYHNVFSYSQPKEFDLGRYPRGHSRSVVFSHPGVVNVYCDIHAYMYATILVLDNPYFSRPADDGSYEITGIPPGTYQLGYWYGRKKIASAQAVVRSGQVTTINFSE